jgi:hypothetical protein
LNPILIPAPQPRWGCFIFNSPPSVAASLSLQRWAEGCNPFGISARRSRRFGGSRLKDFLLSAGRFYFSTGVPIQQPNQERLYDKFNQNSRADFLGAGVGRSRLERG